LTRRLFFSLSKSNNLDFELTKTFAGSRKEGVGLACLDESVLHWP